MSPVSSDDRLSGTLLKAIVTISVSLALWHCFINSSDSYLPVPTSNLDENLFSPKTRGSFFMKFVGILLVPLKF